MFPDILKQDDATCHVPTTFPPQGVAPSQLGKTPPVWPLPPGAAEVPPAPELGLGSLLQPEPAAMKTTTVPTSPRTVCRMSYSECRNAIDGVAITRDVASDTSDDQ